MAKTKMRKLLSHEVSNKILELASVRDIMDFSNFKCLVEVETEKIIEKISEYNEEQFIDDFGISE